MLSHRGRPAPFPTAPDDATVARATLALGMGGAVRTETLRAFTEDEYRRIIGSL